MVMTAGSSNLTASFSETSLEEVAAKLETNRIYKHFLNGFGKEFVGPTLPSVRESTESHAHFCLPKDYVPAQDFLALPILWHLKTNATKPSHFRDAIRVVEILARELEITLVQFLGSGGWQVRRKPNGQFSVFYQRLAQNIPNGEEKACNVRGMIHKIYEQLDLRGLKDPVTGKYILGFMKMESFYNKVTDYCQTVQIAWIIYDNFFRQKMKPRSPTAQVKHLVEIFGSCLTKPNFIKFTHQLLSLLQVPLTEGCKVIITDLCRHHRLAMVDEVARLTSNRQWDQAYSDELDANLANAFPSRRKTVVGKAPSKAPSFATQKKKAMLEIAVVKCKVRDQLVGQLKGPEWTTVATATTRTKTKTMRTAVAAAFVGMSPAAPKKAHLKAPPNVVRPELSNRTSPATFPGSPPSREEFDLACAMLKLDGQGAVCPLCDKTFFQGTLCSYDFMSPVSMKHGPENRKLAKYGVEHCRDVHGNRPEFMLWNLVPYGRHRMVPRSRGARLDALVSLAIRNAAVLFPLEAGKCCRDYTLEDLQSLHMSRCSSAIGWLKWYFPKRQNLQRYKEGLEQALLDLRALHNSIHVLEKRLEDEGPEFRVNFLQLLAFSPGFYRTLLSQEVRG